MELKNPIHTANGDRERFTICTGARYLLGGMVAAAFVALVPSAGQAVSIVTVTSDVPAFDTTVCVTGDPAVTADGNTSSDPTSCVEWPNLGAAAFWSRRSPTRSTHPTISMPLNSGMTGAD